MEQLEKKTLAFIELLKKYYFLERNVEKLLTCMDERVTWLGSGENECAHNFAHTEANLRKEFQEYGGTFVLHDESIHAIALSETICFVYGFLRATPQDAVLETLSLHVTVICELQGEEMKMLHGNFSTTDYIQEDGKFFVPSGKREENHLLLNKLEEKSKQLDNIIRNIPGGAHRCAKDMFFTLQEVSDGFVDMFGYSREEIHTLFSCRFVEMIHPDDQENVVRDAYAQLELGNTIELEYRVMCKSGKFLWILDKGRLIEESGGEKSFYCILVEINERKQAQEQLRLLVEQYQVIMDQATDIIFEWNITTDTLSFSANWRKKFGYDPIEKQISRDIPVSDNIHDADKPAFLKLMQDTAAGVPYSETEFRIRDIEGVYTWCRIRATAQYDHSGRAIRAIGIISDISDLKKEREALLELAQRDALTGLFNKTALKMLVEQHMDTRSAHLAQALFVIDVDFFKNVNDTYGHLCGDTLLSDVSEALKSQFRATDVIGRIGGDEFIVYLPEVPSYEIVKAKAESLRKQLKKIRPHKDAAPISCSIGVVLTMENTVDFLYLYHCADMALYQRKNAGRDGVTFYDADTLEGRKSSVLAETTICEAVAAKEDEVDIQLVENTFHMLYRARDIVVAVNQLLQIIGKSLDVSRVYIFESSVDGTHANNTFGWCGQGVSDQIEIVNYLQQEGNLKEYLANFDEDGIFYCKDVSMLSPELYKQLAPQGICSLLQYVVFEDGKMRGFIGIDECREHKYWTKQQIGTLTILGDILAVFLIKYRLERQIKRLRE